MERLNRWINPLLWVIYLALLAVLLPHTAWAFAVFEPDGQRLVAWSRVRLRGVHRRFDLRSCSASKRLRGASRPGSRRALT